MFTSYIIWYLDGKLRDLEIKVHLKLTDISKKFSDSRKFTLSYLGPVVQN